MTPAQMQPSQTPASNPAVVPALIAAAIVGVGMLVVFWPQDAEAFDPWAISEFDDDTSGRTQLIAHLGEVQVAGLPPGSKAWVELRLQGPVPTEAEDAKGGISLVVEASEPLLSGVGMVTIRVDTVEGAFAVRRIEIEEQGKLVSGLYGEIPWGLVIGMATGAPTTLTVDGATIPFPDQTAAQTVKALRRARDLGFTFATFGVDLDQDRPQDPFANPTPPTPGEEAPLETAGPDDHAPSAPAAPPAEPGKAPTPSAARPEAPGMP